MQGGELALYILTPETETRHKPNFTVTGGYNTKMDEMTEHERFLWEELRAANDMMLLNAYLLHDYIDYINAAGLHGEFEEFRKVKAQKDVSKSS